MLVGIIGSGFITKAIQLLKCPEIDIIVNDINNTKGLTKCDLIFLTFDQHCSCNLLSDIINKLHYHDIIVIGKVSINYCKENNVSYMLDFLTKDNWKEEFINNKKWIFGIDNGHHYVIKKITTLINLSYKYNKIKYKDIVFMETNQAISTNFNHDVTKKVILVTGGAGFIGSNLCRKLVEDKNNTVICLDNLYSGLLTNIEDLKIKSNFKFIKHDVTNKMVFSKIDEIYHLACPASPVFYQKAGIKTIKTSVLGIINILKLCKNHKCKMLFTSTSEIYGDALEHPQKESYWGNVNPVGERSMYDESKRLSETLIYEYKKKYNLDLKIVRLFNTYGPGMRLDDGRVITNYIKCIKENKPITVYGNGNQTRSFCYIDDMIDGLIKMMGSNEQGPINLGNPLCEFTMNKLVEVFENVTGKNLEKQYKPLPSDDPKQRKPDIGLANNKLGWKPKIMLEQGLTKMLKHI